MPSVSVAVTNVGDTAGLDFSGFMSNTFDTVEGVIEYELRLKTMPAGSGATLTLTTSDPAVSAVASHTGVNADADDVTVVTNPVAVTVDCR